MMRTSLAVLSAVLGCSGANSDGTSTNTSTGEAITTSHGASETSTGSVATSTGEHPTSTTASASTGTTIDSSGFVVVPDHPGEPKMCQMFLQDCPPAMKCAPYVQGFGNFWNATKCVPVMGDQLPGEPCTAEGGGITGLDDCIKGAMCWDVDAMNMGTCVAVCTGSEEDAMCPPGSQCAIQEALVLCLPECEPLVQDCPNDELCLPVFDRFICVEPTGETAPTFVICDAPDGCDKGLVCLSSVAADECDPMASGCCSPMCSIADGGAMCPGAGQQCFPVFEPPALGFEDVGYCSLTQL